MLAPTLSIILTVVFTATGGYALYRLAAQASGTDAGVDRTAELAHLVMSVAMIAMVWGWTGGPATASGIVQLVVFGLFSVWFLTGAVAGSATAAPPSPARTGCAAAAARLRAGLHLVAAAAMVWMVGAAPLLMGPPAPSGADSGMAGMPGMGGTATPTPGVEPINPPAWVVSVTVLFALLLVATAALWARYALAGAHRAEQPSAAGAEPIGLAGSRTGRHAAALATAPFRVTMSRLDACCHALMGLGMAAMLAAML